MDSASLAKKFPPSEQTETALVYRKGRITPELLDALDGEEVTVVPLNGDVHGKAERYMEGRFVVRHEGKMTSWSQSYIWFKEITIHLVNERAA